MARGVGIADIGHQPGFSWAGGEADSAYKIELTYELVDLNMKDNRPFWVTEEVTNTDNERGKLRSRFSAAGANLKEPKTFLNAPIMITIEHNEKGYAKITNVTGIPQGVEVSPLSNPTKYFDIYDENPDLETFHDMPDFKQTKIRNALDFEETHLAKALRVEEEEM